MRFGLGLGRWQRRGRKAEYQWMVDAEGTTVG